ncbi:neogenin [Phlebotomus argentipes]|uniref:neogenin n=1 Tax=Phlebotomus argentipes TaxID=94469 RepID=UPI00289339C0|nr:neogenin [Phlebotomus argentipes]
MRGTRVQCKLRCDTVILATILTLSGLFTKCHGSQALEFTLEPVDVAVQEGNSVLLQCSGRMDPAALKDGKTAPNIRWRGPDGQEIGIVGDTFRTQLQNGSLYISSIEENRGLTGTYQCLLTADGIGTIVSRPATVSIATLPELNQEFNEIYLFPGQTAYFRCLTTKLPANVAYSVEWIKDDVPLLVDESRMLILQSGALEIDELSASDRGTYQCNVTAGGASKLSSKSNLNIKSTAGVPESFASPSFVVVPAPQTVREGETVTLECVANGNPKPVIRWLKNGGDIDMNDLDSRFRIVGTGSLQILSAEDHDSGDYQCRAINSVDSLDASASVLVQVPPKFIQSPEDKSAFKKEELELECAIHGKPTPVVQWLKNGDLITPNDYMQIVGGSNLRILGLIGSDAGMFQCIGSNPAGAIQASARLEIIQPDGRKRDKGAGKPLPLMPKSASASREKMLNNRLLSKSAFDSLLNAPKRRNTSDDDDLTLGDYNDDDAGSEEEDEDYDDEEDEGTIHPYGPNVDPKKLFNSLMRAKDDSESEDVEHFSNPYFPPVTRKRIDANFEGSSPLPGPPRDLEAQIVKPRFISLSWLEPLKNPDEVITYTVFYKMTTSDRERKITTKSRDEQQVNIQSLLPGKTYQFRVVGNSVHGSGETSAILEESTQPEENISGPPRSVMGIPISHREVHVKWEPPLVTNGLISKYRVYYFEIEDGAEMYMDSTTLEATLTELRPFTEYTISVVPFNQNGMGDPSNEIKVKTYSSTPSEPPHNVSLEATSSTSVTISWEPPPEDKRNGQITGYKIRYRKMKKLQVETTPGNVRHYELKNLERHSAYQVKISAMTVNGSGPFTEWMHVQTFENDLDETQTPKQPDFIRTRPSAESIIITWGPPRDTNIKLRGFTLGWGKGLPDVEMKELDSIARYYEIKGLEPNSEYVISLKARNLVGDGPPIYDYVRTREEALVEPPAPLEVPVGLRAITMSSNSIVVYWTDTTLSKSQQVTDNRHYLVRYNPVATTRFKYHNTTSLNCMIGDLKSNMQYEFTVKVAKGRRQSAWSMSVFNTTLQQNPIPPPRDLAVRIDDHNPQNVILHWQISSQFVDQVTGFLVYYTTDTSKRDRDWAVEAIVGNSQTMAVIKNLMPYTTYYFKVQTRNIKGYGPFSTMVSHTTGKEVLTREQPSTLGGFSNTSVLYLIIGVALLLVLIGVIIVAIVCRRKTPSTPDHAKKSYHKNNAGIIKPPDLWIHHDQMELKNIEKNNQQPPQTQISDGASSSGAMTLPRSVIHDYDSETPISHVTNSLDKRSYVPGYITTPMSSSMERPQFPRTQYSMSSQGHMSVGQTPVAQTPENPYAYETMPSNYSNPSITYAPGIAVDSAPKRGKGHPLKSFSGPPNTGVPIIPVPAVTIRPQNASPFKKPSLATNPMANRLQNGSGVVAHSADEVQRLAPSTSTEELNQEMANLEGLMKDLSAITANEFEC